VRKLSVYGITCIVAEESYHYHCWCACSEAEVKALADKGEVLATVGQDIRLNHRFLDLRTPANQAIFRLQSGVCQVRCQGFQMCS